MGTGISNHASGIPMTHLCICEAKSGYSGHEVTPDRKALKVIVSHLESYVNGKIPKGRYSKAKKVCKEVSFSPPIVDSNAGFTQFRIEGNKFGISGYVNVEKYQYKKSRVIFSFEAEFNSYMFGTVITNITIINVQRVDWYSRFQECTPKGASAKFCLCGRNELLTKPNKSN